ncbi:MAG: DUF5677 domain-containing protein [Candidatus Acidiferrales bacterium]
MEVPLTGEGGLREGILQKYKGHFAHFHDLQQICEWSLVRYRDIARGAYHASLQLICPKALKSYDSIRRLCEIASCEDAAVILRSLLNLLVVTRWISLDGENRARKYLDWYWVQLHRDAERFHDVVPAEWLREIDGRYHAVKVRFEVKGKQGKAKMVKHWYQPEANTIFDMFQAVDMQREYEEAYQLLSGFEHSDCISYFPMLREADRKEGGTELAVHSDIFVPHYLRNAFQYFAGIFQICNDTMVLADPMKFEAIVAAGISFYADHMKP